MTSASDEIVIQVHYPRHTESITLRTDHDWDAVVQPVHVDAEKGLCEFRIRTDQPFVYYKAVLTLDGEERWAIGDDRLATSGAERVRDVFPAFDHAEARITDSESMVSELGEWSYRVFLPANYEENSLHRYPVLYMNDGHNLFFREEAAAGRDWGVHDTLVELVGMTSIEPVIVVAVYPRDREGDYAAADSVYPTFLARHLKPHVDRTLRTLPDARHNATMGSSLGGVAALMTAWQYPDAFGMAGCLSASFGYQDDLAARVLGSGDDRPRIRVYLDSGYPRDNYEVTRDMRARLARVGFREGIDLLYFAFPGERHSERAWGERCHVPFQFFFGQRPDERSWSGARAAGAAERSGL